MKKLIIAILAASGAAVVYAQAETNDRQAPDGGFRAEMRALIDGDGLRIDDLTRLMQERSHARFATLDADEDGVVDLEEFLAATDERSQARFERMGPNEDGVVTRAGRKGWGGHHRGGPRERSSLTPEQRAERVNERAAETFARLDADGDGAISLEEFQAGEQARAERFAERRAERRADHRKDRGGHREQRAERRGEMPAEMREMHAQFRALLREGMTLESFSGLMREHATARFEALDADGDGKLTAEEFTANAADRAQRLFARMDRNEDGVVTGEDRPRGGWRGGPRR